METELVDFRGNGTSKIAEEGGREGGRVNSQRGRAIAARLSHLGEAKCE